MAKAPGDTEGSTQVAETAKYRIWTMHCPFNKYGVPVVGSFGSRIRGVVIIPLDTWTQLCKDVPQLQTTKFDVGSYE